MDNVGFLIELQGIEDTKSPIFTCNTSTHRHIQVKKKLPGHHAENQSEAVC